MGEVEAIEVMMSVVEMMVMTLDVMMEVCSPDLVCFSSTINISMASVSLPCVARARAAGSFSSHAELGLGLSFLRRQFYSRNKTCIFCSSSK